MNFFSDASALDVCLWLYLMAGYFLWWLLLPLGLLATWAAFRKKSLSTRMRIGLSILAIALFIPAGYGVHEVLIEPAFDAWQYRRRSWQLEAPTQVAGLSLPAGSTVQLSSYTKPNKRSQLTAEDIEVIRLPGETQLMGAMLTGRLRSDLGYSWEVELVKDQMVQGWLCAKGEAAFRAKDGSLYRCNDPQTGESLTDQIELSKKERLP
ncbi:hypothetical protein [Pseudoxanthomonas putridarboris]|uniref:Uncharacterized protein n=1 Tax=Pseudoxanthomonas putridarboris TaxID=752605 RepID=A0ABU9J5A5_9GAMM